MEWEGQEVEFEVFKPEVVQSPREMAVSVQRGGVIALSPAAYEALGEPEAVELLFALRERVMGFRPANPEQAPHAYRARAHKASRSRLISGRKFLTHYGIDVEKGARYPAKMVGDTLVVPLADDSPRAR